MHMHCSLELLAQYLKPHKLQQGNLEVPMIKKQTLKEN